MEPIIAIGNPLSLLGGLQKFDFCGNNMNLLYQAAEKLVSRWCQELPPDANKDNFSETDGSVSGST
jgi:hypothetical protein